jgi:beta-mannosidase
MRARVSTHTRLPLDTFELLLTAPERYATPSQVEGWSEALPFQVPGCVAGALSRAGRFDLSAPPDLDQHDAWLRTRLPETLPAGAQRLVFEGLATLCDVWLDGEPILNSQNMFRSYSVDRAQPLRPGMELSLRCAALGPWLAQKRPRPRFRTQLVETQQLRWLRTSLVGRTPGSMPRVPALGPYRPIYVEAQPTLALGEHTLVARVLDGKAQLELTLQLALRDPDARLSASLKLSGAAASGRFPLEQRRSSTGALQLEGRFVLEDAALWWPHTHGEQPLSRVQVELSFAASDERVSIDLGTVGFRALEVERGSDGAGFQLHVNGVPVFCRGACWTPDDLLSLSSDTLQHTLLRARAAGMNMLRVGGTTLYESDAFYDACDALGILVFQDFMFANLDYPASDVDFLAEVEREVDEQLTRLMGRPALAVLCGGSEVEQQVAMLGLAPEFGQSPLFYQLLPELVRARLSDIPYVPNSPCGGALPFQLDAGIAHYYGVGAYLRPLHDVRLSGVRFAAECLAFSNVPERAAIEALLSDLEMPVHHPRWKERVPRDRGAGWDFEDVRDHYLEQLYGASARTLRASDVERYLSWSRAVVVDVMEATLGELRRAGSRCGGALVWWLKDVWLGAGFGVLDASGHPKSAYYALRRAFAPLALWFSDEGMNGPGLQLVHDAPHALNATLSLSLYRAGQQLLNRVEQPLTIAPRSAQTLRVDALFPRFLDAGYVYRFGPVSHDLITAELTAPDGRVLARASALPLGSSVQLDELGLSGAFELRQGRLGVRVTTQRFARRVELELDSRDVMPEDNFFQLAPGSERWIALDSTRGTALDTARDPALPKAMRGSLRALNQRTPFSFAWRGTSP